MMQRAPLPRPMKPSRTSPLPPIASSARPTIDTRGFDAAAATRYLRSELLALQTRIDELRLPADVRVPNGVPRTTPALRVLERAMLAAGPDIVALLSLVSQKRKELRDLVGESGGDCIVVLPAPAAATVALDDTRPGSPSPTHASGYETPLLHAPAAQAALKRIEELLGAALSDAPSLELALERIASAIHEQQQLESRVQAAASRSAAPSSRTTPAAPLVETALEMPLSVVATRPSHVGGGSVSPGPAREVRRAHALIAELEQKLVDAERRADAAAAAAAAAARDRAAAVARHDDAVRALAEAHEERDEKVSLFVGVTQARGEEARMSNLAVRQLEDRVDRLEDANATLRTAARNLSGSLQTTLHHWAQQRDALDEMDARLRLAHRRAEAYATVYGPDMAAALDKSQRRLLEALRLADEQEAQLAMNRQLIDDAAHVRRVGEQEDRTLMERLRQSPEWRQLNAKAADDMKQLAVRLMLLRGERERKEQAYIQAQNERIATVRTRADREKAQRLEQHAAEVSTVNAIVAAETLRSAYASGESQLQDELNTEHNGSAIVDVRSLFDRFLVTARDAEMDIQAYHAQAVQAILDHEG